MTTLKIDLVSDIACPWCAIGYARFERALASLPEINIELEWHAFELNPDKNAAQEPILPALSRKYGKSEAEMRLSQAHIMEVAAELGLNFSKMQQRFTCNTFDAHRLVKWAETQGQATAMKMALFDIYFGDAADISNHQILLNCVTKLGLDVTTAEQILASDAFSQQVQQDLVRYQHAGISSVPAFIINNKYLISGAQEPQKLALALQQIAAEIN